jgi:hypothetical protein
MDNLEAINDIISYSKISDCCGAQVVLEDICMECKEHCTPICENCGEEICDC